MEQKTNYSPQLHSCSSSSMLRPPTAHDEYATTPLRWIQLVRPTETVNKVADSQAGSATIMNTVGKFPRWYLLLSVKDPYLSRTETVLLWLIYSICNCCQHEVSFKVLLRRYFRTATAVMVGGRKRNWWVCTSRVQQCARVWIDVYLLRIAERRYAHIVFGAV